MTLWEQLEPGEYWTPTKKYLMLVPTVLCFITLLATNYSTPSLLLNVPIWALLVVAKLPMMEGVRIFGINSTAGANSIVLDLFDFPPLLTGLKTALRR